MKQKMEVKISTVGKTGTLPTLFNVGCTIRAKSVCTWMQTSERDYQTKTYWYFGTHEYTECTFVQQQFFSRNILRRVCVWFS